MRWSNGRFALRACIVNFRTSLADIEALPTLLARHGREVDRITARVVSGFSRAQQSGRENNSGGEVSDGSLSRVYSSHQRRVE